MAAGQNWKRPWEDDDNGGLDHSQRTTKDAWRTSGRHPGFESARAHDEEHATKEGIPSTHSDVEKMAPLSSDHVSPSTYRHAPLKINPRDDHGGRYARSNSPSNSPKRRRLFRDEMPRDVLRLSSFANGQNSQGLRFEDLTENSLGTQGSENNIALSDPRFNAHVEPHRTQSLGERKLSVEVNRSEYPTLEMSRAQLQCPTCSNLQGIVTHIVEGLCGFRTELSVKLASDSLGLAGADVDYQREASDVANYGLKRSLEWVLVKIQESIRVVKDLVALENSKSQQKESSFQFLAGPHSTEEATTLKFLSGSRNNSLHIERLINGEDDKARQGRLGVGERVSPPQSDDGSRSMEISRVRSTLLERRSNAKDHFPPHILPSPHANTSLSTNVFTRPQSPMQAPQTSRLLPSPSSMSFAGSSTLPPMSPSVYQSKSPHTAHLQELQHQLSTKSLAFQILQGEHDKLLAAFSRSQTRCATLDRKSQASETEINNLSEDQIRMQAQIEAYESQIEDLQQSRDEAWRQSSANGAQYMQIIEMSSKLQAKGVTESRRWQEEKETLEKEKADMMDKLDALETQGGPLGFGPTLASSQNAFPAQSSSLLSPNQASDIKFNEDIISSTSIGALRKEIVRLRMANLDIQRNLEGVRGENVHIKEIISILDGVSRRMGKDSLTHDDLEMGYVE